MTKIISSSSFVMSNLKCYLLILIVCLSFTICLKGQIVDKDNTVLLSDSSEMQFETEDYSALVGSQYMRRFSEFSRLLSAKEGEEVLSAHSHEVLINRLQEAIDSKTRKQVRTQLKNIKLNDKKLSQEITLIKKALSILKENRDKSESHKLVALDKVEKIEFDIRKIEEKYENQKSDLVLSNISVNTNDPYTNPPKEDCILAFSGLDPATKKIRKETTQAFLFGYTHPKLKSYFKDKHFLTGESQIILLHNRYYWYLKITIASKDAIKNYGYIEKNSPLKIELLNKETIYISNSQNTTGKLEPYTANTVYQLILPLDKGNGKVLQKTEVDKIGIMWSSGYEEYEIMHVDRVKNQINCIQNN